MYIPFDTIPQRDALTDTKWYNNIALCMLAMTRSSADADKPARRVQRSVKVTKHGTIRYVRYGFLLVCYSNFVSKDVTFLRYSTSKNVVTLKSGSKVIGTDTDRPAAYDFLLTFHRNNGLISYRFRDRRRFQSKVAPLPVILQPHVVLENRSGEAMWPRKKYDDIFIRFDTIPVCDRQTDRQTDRQPRDDSNSRAHAQRRAVKNHRK